MNLEHHQIICDGLEKFAGCPSDGACWVTFEANDGEHWLQYSRDQLNMDWPFAEAPEPSQLKKHLAALGSFEIVAWDFDLYATINLVAPRQDALALTIGLIFRELYGLGTEYKLTYELEECGN